MSRLGGLPLAITIAGAFMRETGTSIQKFLQYYQESWHALQMRARPDRYYQGNLLQTWLVSYNEIQKRDAHVAELMLLLAHFDNRDIWYELVKSVEHSSQSPVWFDDVVSDSLTFRDNIRTLSQFSLIEVNQLSDSYSIHPVIQDWCLDMARNNNDGLSSPWHELALVAVGTMVPSTHERDYWQLQRRLLVHADFMWQGLKSGLLSADISVWYALFQLGNLYSDQGKLKEAETMYQRALAVSEKAYGPDNHKTKEFAATLTKLSRKQRHRVARLLHRK
jgi:tetratricopeptide (TPR) repeat protein